MYQARIILVVLALVAGAAYILILDERQDPLALCFDGQCGLIFSLDPGKASPDRPPKGRELGHRDSFADVSQDTTPGSPGSGMPTWSPTSSGALTQSLAIWFAERRGGFKRNETETEISTAHAQDGTPPSTSRARD